MKLTVLLAASLAGGTAAYVQSTSPDATVIDTSTSPPSATIEPPPTATPSLRGVIIANQSADLVAEHDGAVEALHVELGTTVNQGQALARLQLGDLTERLATAEAERRLAKAAVQRANIQLRRARVAAGRTAELSGVIAPDEIESAKTEAALAEADVETEHARVRTARARVDELSASVGRATIRSPFSGRIAAIYKAVGDGATRGERVLRVIGGPLRLRFAIEPEVLAQVTVGTAVRAMPRSPTGPTPPVHGVVTHVSPEVDPASGLVVAEASFDPEHPRPPWVRAGVVVRVQPQAAAPGSSTLPLQ